MTACEATMQPRKSHSAQKLLSDLLPSLLLLCLGIAEISYSSQTASFTVCLFASLCFCPSGLSDVPGYMPSSSWVKGTKPTTEKDDDGRREVRNIWGTGQMKV